MIKLVFEDEVRVLEKLGEKYPNSFNFLIRFLRTGNLSKVYTQKLKTIYTIRYAYSIVRICEQFNGDYES